MTEQKPQASVVLPTYNRRASLLRVLRALGRQGAPTGAFEVVVVCDGDVDGSAAACRALAPELPYILRVVEQENSGPAAARNHGVDEACAPLIVFLDDDVVPDEGLIATHLAAQAGQEARVTIGPLLPPLDARLNVWGAWEERTLCRQYDDMQAGRFEPTHRQFYTGNASVLKRHILSAGGFDPAFRRAEDVELAWRLAERGLSFVFLPQARGWHYIQRPFSSWLRTPAAYGAADVAIARARRPELLRIVAIEYKERPRSLRFLVGLCAGRSRAMRPVVALVGAAVRGANMVGAARIGNVLCAMLFAVCYYDGVAAALGGRSALTRLLQGGDVTAILGGLAGPEKVTA